MLNLAELPRRFLHTITFLSGEGSWNLLDHEATVIDSLQKFFDHESWLTISTQLSQPYFVERIPDGRINILRYYKPNKLNCLTDNKYQDLLLKLRISVDGKASVSNITFYKGYIFSIEFKLAKKAFKNKIITVTDIQERQSQESFTVQINNEEHDKQNV